MKFKDLSGSRFGRLKVLNPTRVKNKRWYYLCKCDCGTTKEINSGNMTTGKIVSCGCIKKELLVQRNKDMTTHGKTSHSLYVVWDGIKKRSSINRKHNVHMSNYRDRGIFLCEEWDSSFESFYIWAIDNGYKKNLQIDRIDNNSGYSPINCRFVTSAINSINRRDTLSLDVVLKGKEMYNQGHSIAHISRELKVKYSGLYQAITGRRGKSRVEKVTRTVKNSEMDLF